MFDLLAIFLALLWLIKCCLRFLIRCQLASNVKFVIASHPNTNCIGVACVVVWTVDCIVRMTTELILLHFHIVPVPDCLLGTCVGCYLLFDGFFPRLNLLGDTAL